ncbi:MAG TPA: hypothetical protein VGB18_09465, partial [Candidatus Thermoplasmatota archaeon]
GDVGTVLEVAPLFFDAAPETWCLALFRLENGPAVPVGIKPHVGDGYYISIPNHLSSVRCQHAKNVADGPLATRTNEAATASTAPFFWILDDPVLTPGMRLVMVAGADSSESSQSGFAFRFVDHFPTGQETPSPDADAFLAERGALEPGLLRILGNGKGLQVGYFGSTFEVVNDFTRPRVAVREEWNDGLDVRQTLPDARPVLGGGIFNGSFAYNVDQGWSLVEFRYKPLCANGQWSASGFVHGTKFETAGPLVATICGFLTWAFLGNGNLLVAAGGKGAAEVDVSLSAINVGTEGVLFRHVGFGTELVELIGAPAAVVIESDAGLAFGPI